MLSCNSMAAGEVEKHQFSVPERLVKDVGDLETWKNSQVRPTIGV